MAGSGESELEFRVNVGGLNHLGQLRSQVIKLSHHTTQLKNNSLSLSAAFPKLEGAAKDLQKIYFGQARSMKQLVRNQKVFRNEIRSQTGMLKTARKETKAGSAAWRVYTSQIIRARKQMRKLPLRKLGTDLRNVSKNMLKRGKEMQWVGRQMMVGITAPMAMVMRVAMQAFEAFEKQFVRTKKILGLTETQASGLRERMSELSTSLGASRSIVAGLTSDFAQMGQKMLQGGIGSQQALQDTAADYAELTLQLEHVGQVSAQVGRDFIANLAGIIDVSGKAGDKIDYVRGLLAKFNMVENTTALSLKDLAEAFPQVSPAAIAAGVDLVFLSGVIGGMRQAGLNATESAHALKFALQRMINPTRKVRDMAHGLRVELGPSFHEDLGIGNMMLFKLSENLLNIANNASDETALKYLGELVGKRQASRIFAASLALGTFADNVKDVGQVFKEAGLERAGRAISEVVDTEGLSEEIKKAFSTEDSIDEFLESVRSADMETGAFGGALEETTGRAGVMAAALGTLSPPMKALVIDYMGATSAGKQFQAEFEAVMGGPAMQMQLMKNDVKNMLLDLGAAFFDTIQGIIPQIRRFIQGLQNMSPDVKKAILVIGTFLAVLGPMSFILGQATNAIGSMTRAAAAFLPKMITMTRSMLLGKTLAGESLPAMRRFGTGWVAVGRKVRGASMSMNKSFRAVSAAAAFSSPGSGFGEAIVRPPSVIGHGGAPKGAAGRSVRRAALGVPKGGIQQTKITSRNMADLRKFHRAFGASNREINQMMDGQMGRMGARFVRQGEHMDRLGGKAKRMGKTLANAFTKQVPGMGPASKVNPFGARMAALQRGQVGPQKAVRPITQNLAKPFQAAHKKMNAAQSAFGKKSTATRKFFTQGWRKSSFQTGRGIKAAFFGAGRGILKSMGGAFKIIRIQGLLTASTFSTAWRISMKIVRKAMLTAGPIALLVILTAAIMFVVQNIDRFKEAASGAFDTFKQAWANIVGTFKEIGAMFFEIFDDLFGNKSEEGGKKVADSMSGVSNVINGVAQIVLKFSQIFRTVLLKVIPPILEYFLKAIKLMATGIGFVLGWISDHWVQIKEVVVEVIYRILQVLEFWVDANLVVLTALAGILRLIGKLFFNLLDYVVVPVFQGIWLVMDKLLEVIIGVVGKVVGFMITMMQAIKDPLNGLLDIINTIAGWLGFDIDLKITDELESLEDTAKGFFETVQDGREGIASFIEGDLANTVRTVGNAVDTGLEFAGEGLGAAIGLNVADGLHNALGGVASGSNLAPDVERTTKDAIDEGADDAFSDIDAADLQAEIQRATAEGLLDAYSDWVSRVKTRMKKDMKFEAAEGLKVFDAFSKVFLDSFETRITAIKEQQKAEKRLTKTIEYETKRRDLINRLALQKENFVRNRALALYEGRIEDARNLTVKFKINSSKGETDVGMLDTKRSKAILEEKRKDLLAEIKAAQENKAEIIAIQRTKLEELLADLQKELPKSEAEWQKYKSDVTAAVTTGMEDAFGLDGASFGSVTTFAAAADSAVTEQFASLFSESGIVQTGITGVSLAVKTAVEDWTGEAAAFHPGFTASLATMFDEIEDAWANDLDWEIVAHGWAAGRERILLELVPLMDKLKQMKTDVEGLMEDMFPGPGKIAGPGMESGAGSWWMQEGSGIDFSGATNAAPGTPYAGGRVMDGGLGAVIGGAVQTAISYVLATSEREAGLTTPSLPVVEIDLEPYDDTFTADVPGRGGPWLNSSREDRDDDTFLDRTFTDVSNLGASAINNATSGINAAYNAGTGAVADTASTGWGWMKNGINVLNRALGTEELKYYGGRVSAQYGRYLGGFQSSMVPVAAHGGEYVMSARAVQNVGLSKLESMNHTKNYQGGGGGGTNIFVENFIGEPEWFESMMGDYNVNVAPKNERSRGLESRRISSMADNNRRGRV